MIVGPKEDAEVALILARARGNDIIATAEDLGVGAIDPTTAARNVLREMRRRGFIIRFPELG